MNCESLLYYEYNYGDMFECTRLDILNAEFVLNTRYAMQTFITLNDFYESVGLPITVEGDYVGWSFDDHNHGPRWIRFETEMLELEDGMECTIIKIPEPYVLT